MKTLVIAGILLLPFNLDTNTKQLPDGFVYLGDVVADVQTEMRYYSTNNFVGDTIDGYESSRCILSTEAAQSIKKVQDYLKSMHMSLKIFDAYRPQRAVDHFVRWANDTLDVRMKATYYPNVKKSELIEKGYIAPKSGHSRGSTVDVSLIFITGELSGKEIDMGTPWDLFDLKSWSECDKITEDQQANRLFLRKAMGIHGFIPLKEEWWHFTLENEPYPDTYFNFIIK